MVGRGKGRRDGGQGDNQIAPAFDQQAFMEAIGAVTATIAHATVAVATIPQSSATTGQRGISSL